MRNERQRRWRWVLVVALAVALGLWFERSEVAEDRAQQGLASDREISAGGESGAKAEANGAARSGESAGAGERKTARDGIIELKISAGGAKQAGAEVRLFRRGERDPNTGKIVWSEAGSAKSGSDGAARLPAIAGRYLAIVAYSGYANGYLEIRRPLGEPITRAQLELEHGSSLNGKTILRGTREPVALAQLSCIPTFSTQLGSDLPAEAKVPAASDASGNFSIPQLAPGLWQVDAAAPGGGRASARGVRIPRGGSLVLELVASSYLEGHVLAADGSPAAGAELTARQRDRSEHAVSSESGAFSIEVSPGPWSLIAQRGEDAGGLPHAVGVAEGQTLRGLEIRLGKGATLAGMVSHRGDKAPLAGARILVSPHGEDGDSGRAISDAGGKYQLTSLAPGLYDAVAELEGYQRSETRGLALGAGERYPLDFSLGGSGSVEGYVRDAHSRPVEGALLEGRGQSQLGEGSQARTDSDGSYRLSGVASGAAEVIARRASPGVGSKKTVNVIEGGTVHADFVLAGNGRVVGRVTRANGPLPDGVTVGAMRNQMAVNLEDIDRAPVAPDGSYQLELPAGSYRISATGDHSSTSSRDTIAVEADQTLTHDLVLPDARDLGLAITVLEPGGAPSPNARVQVEGVGGRSYGNFSAADENGQDFIDGPRSELPDNLKVTASNSTRSGSAMVGPGVTQVTVQLETASSLHGRLIDSAPVAQFRIELRPLQNSGMYFFNGDSALNFFGDQFDIADAQAGTFEVHAVTSDGRSGETTVTIASGASAEADITLSPATSLHGRAVDENSQPVIGAYISLDRGGAPVETDADGSFRFDGVAPGSHRISGFLAPGTTASMNVEISQGQQLDVGVLVLASPKAAPGTIGLQLRGDSSGVYAAAVTPGSPADLAGILAGDQIQSIDGTPCAGISDALARIRGAPGTVVSLVLIRNGHTLAIQVTRAS